MLVVRSVTTREELRALIDFLREDTNGRQEDNEKYLTLSFGNRGGLFFGQEDVVDLRVALQNCSFKLDTLIWVNSLTPTELEELEDLQIGPAPDIQDTISLLKCMSQNLKELNYLSHHEALAQLSPLTTTHQLATLVANSKNLTHLLCNGSRFGGPPSRFQELARALKHHPTLVEASFGGCSIEDPLHSNILCVRQALSTMPRLEYLQLGCWIPLLDNPDLTANDVASCFQVPPNLTNLSIASAGNHRSSLSKRLFCDGVQELVGTNGTLNILLLHLSHFGEEARPVSILRALEANPNSSIQRLELNCGERQVIGQENQQAIVSLLESNFNLTELSIKTYDSTTYRDYHVPLLPHIKNQVRFYLEANRCGRKIFEQAENPDDVADEDWIQSLAKANDNVKVLFYFLSLKPNAIRHG